MKLKDLMGFEIIDIAETALLRIQKLVIKKGEVQYLLHTNKEGKIIIEEFKRLESKEE